MASSATPSYGHVALATLMALDKIRIVWTTNFDRIVEDSTSRIFGTSTRLVVSTLDTPNLASEAIQENRWPLFVKLHGDLQSRQLKNTTPELQTQDAKLRETLTDACQRFGLVIIGYSGRDHSVMECLESALVSKQSFPQGIFWIHRSDAIVSDRVKAFIDKAKNSGIDAHLVSAETFDEVVADLINLLSDLPDEMAKKLDAHAPRFSNAPLRQKTGEYPLIRLNALPLIESPATCRRIVCNIGGYREIRDAISSTKANVIAGRRNIGVIAFGSDDEVRKAFEPFQITEFDLHSIEPRKLGHESAEFGLVYEAFCIGLSRILPVTAKKRRGRYLLVLDSTRLTSAQSSSLKKSLGPLFGEIPKTDIKWSQALKIKLEYRIDRLWVVLEPTFWAEFTAETPKEHSYAVSDYFREKGATRYNPAWSTILDCWIDFIFSTMPDGALSTFGSTNGADAQFRLGKRTAYTFRERGAR